MNIIKSSSGQSLSSKLKEMQAMLRKVRVRIDFETDRQPIHLDVFVQDTLPAGSNIGTVVGCHGTPGSHADFKYIVPHLDKCGIRFIGINFPGQGHTPHHEGLNYTNEERLQFAQKVIDAMDLGNNIVFLGHSRGSENALKLAAKNPDRCKGVALINPVGVNPHRAMRPMWIVKVLMWIWDTFKTFHFILQYMYYKIFLMSKIKVKNGIEAAVCLKLLANIDLPGQVRYIDMLNSNKTKALIAYSSMDHLIETSISQEFASLFTNINHMNYSPSNANTSVLDYIAKQYAESDQSFSVRFENENHYLQKNQANFIANCTHSMLIAKNGLHQDVEKVF